MKNICTCCKPALTALVALLFFLPANAQKKSEPLLLGTWVYRSDPTQFVTFTGEYKIDWSDEKRDTSIYVLKNNHLTVRAMRDTSNVYEYDVMSATFTDLTLMYLGRGNLLRLRRVLHR